MAVNFKSPQIGSVPQKSGQGSLGLSRGPFTCHHPASQWLHTLDEAENHVMGKAFEQHGLLFLESALNND